MMKYRLFLSDFDGTLVRSDGTISQRNIEAIARYRRAGGIFAVCTGRMLTSILPRLHELGLGDGLAVAFQGATIADVATGKLLKDEGFGEEDALRVVRLLEAEDVHIHIYTVDALYANRDDELLRIYEEICRVRRTAVIAKLSDFIEEKHPRVVKALAMVEPEKKAALAARLSAALGERFFVTCSSDWLVEIMPAGQDKASAAEFLSAYYGVPKEEIAAIGDQLNDLPLLRAAGGRFAVANAEEELKREATVVPSFEEDGVAFTLENYAMGDLR